MELNKRCISAFSNNLPFVALATKSKIFDSSFSLNSELILVNYMTNTFYDPIAVEQKFCVIKWCEFGNENYLAAGHENGGISIYKLTKDGLSLLKFKVFAEDDITALDFLPSKAVLVAGSSRGKIVFWTLSNLDKDYTLNIPLALEISALSWNPKVSKILCVGSKDGKIKVLDIKKNSVIMTSSKKDFTEVRKLEWNSENYTKLFVMTERNFLMEFDLSADSTNSIGDHPDELIGFEGNITVSRSLLVNNGVVMPIPEAFDCSISKSDPFICLSCVDSTKIISIPFVKNAKPFFQIKNNILGFKTQQRIRLPEAQFSVSEYLFYLKFIEVEDLKEKSKLLLENSKSEDGTLEININDPLTREFIDGTSDSLKNCETKIPLKYLSAFSTRDLSVLNGESDFNVLFAFSKLLEDFSLLTNLNNSRAAFALFINNSISLEIIKTKEFQILKSLFRKDYDSFFDFILSGIKCYREKMSFLDYFLNNSKIGMSNLKSKHLSDLYLFKRSQDQPVEKLQQFAPTCIIVSDGPNVSQLVNKMSNINFQEKGAQIPTATMTPMAQISTTIPNTNMVQPSFKTPVSAPFTTFPSAASSIPQNPTANIPLQRPPTNNNSPHMSSLQQPPMNSNPAYASSVQRPPISANPAYPSNPSSVQRPPISANPAYPSNPSVNIPQHHAPISANIPHMSPLQRPPINANSAVNMPQNHPHMGANPSPLMRPSSSIPSPFPNVSQRQGFPAPPVSPVSVAVPNPLGAFPGFNRPPTLPQQNTPQDVNTALSVPLMPKTPEQPRPIIIPDRFTSDPNSVQHGFPTNQERFDAAGFNHMKSAVPNGGLSCDTATVLSSFDECVVSAIQRSASLNSLIFKARKTQLVSILNDYLAMDKSLIPLNIIHVMDQIVKRVAVIDGQMKKDLDQMVSPYIDVTWVKAYVELVKMIL